MTYIRLLFKVQPHAKDFYALLSVSENFKEYFNMFIYILADEARYTGKFFQKNLKIDASTFTRISSFLKYF